ncbi:MAG: chemotaxis protein [Candidatus Xenolissoclinum pacificiensis L6]|uniref:Chemotaxis protein n=1 Tax=Candidatus Xenolissoclinum pacificiensis L6 TaxID=1401685 RepID=W2UYM9_9RICK|nr:MAG: chemotaxis protein [Candidatus Xenolissoclinum pacificiensis L6]
MGSILISFYLMGGNLLSLLQFGEIGIILGTAIGALVISTPFSIFPAILNDLKKVFQKDQYPEIFYTELLVTMFQILKIMRQGLEKLEPLVENPHENEIFQNHKLVSGNEHVMTFLCDHLRVVIMGLGSSHEIENLIHEEIETYERDCEAVNSALTNMADGFPAFGIVAAVLGVIITMASIDQPPAILGKLLAGALVGTFLGIFFAYGLVGPVAKLIERRHMEEAHYMSCIKNALVSFLGGNSAYTAVEMARKSLPKRIRPSFQSLESSLQNNSGN